MSDDDSKMIGRLMDANPDLRQKMDALRRKSGIRVELHEIGQDIAVRMTVAQDKEPTARDLREATKLVGAWKSAIVRNLGPDQIDDGLSVGRWWLSGAELESLYAHRQAGESDARLVKMLNEEARASVRAAVQRHSEVAEAQTRLDTYLVERGLINTTDGSPDELAILRDEEAIALVCELLPLLDAPAENSLVHEGMQSLNMGEDYFQKWEPFTAEDVRQLLRYWTGEKRPKAPPPRRKYLDAVAAKNFDEERRVFDRLGIPLAPRSGADVEHTDV